MELSLGLLLAWEGRFGSWRCWEGGVESKAASRIGSERGGEKAHPKEPPRVLLWGEKGGRTDFTGLLKLCAIQAVRKL